MRNRSPFVFPLDTARHLPVTGSLHPLRAESARWLSAGNAITVLGAFTIAVGVTLVDRAVTELDPVGPRIQVIYDFASPPEVPPLPGEYTVARSTAPPFAGFEPVDAIIDTPDETITGTRAGEGNGDAPSDGGAFDVPIVVTEPDTVLKQDVFNVYDALPEVLAIDPPLYPGLARQAGIDGIVSVRVRIGKDGKVREAVVLDGAEPLHAAALASVRTAVFKPALQGTRPVEVWVVMPVVFELQER